MPTIWRQLLQDTAAQWQEEELTAFTEPTTEAEQALAGDVIAPLPSLAIIEASGADATEFLQSQLSNDITALPEHGSCLAAYCNPKGRMLALFRIIRRPDSYLLLFPAGLAEGALKRLRMFVLRSKVTFTDLSEQWGILGISGSQAEALLTELGLNIPAEADAGAWQDDVAIVRLRGDQPRALVIAPQEHLSEVWSALEPLNRIGEMAWRLLDVRAGVPQVLPGAAEQIIPQMANLDLLNGISFTKGCFPGQEIVARLHYLGNLNRRMYHLSLDTDKVPAPGTDVRTVDGNLGGEVLMGAPSTEGKVEVLAVLQIRRAEDELQINEHAATVQPVPYMPEE